MSKNSIIIPSHLTSALKDYQTEHFKIFMEAYSEKKIELFVEKDGQYNGSWQTDGFFSAYFNLKRKMDRVINKFKNGTLFKLEKDVTNETLIDTFMDLENYSSMVLCYLFLSVKTKEDFEYFTTILPKLRTVFSYNEKECLVKLVTSK